MTSVNVLNIDQLAKYILLANTPYFLYRKIYQDETVIELSEKLETTQLVYEFLATIGSASHLEDAAIIYGIIFSLAHKPPSEVISFFHDLSERPLKWAKHISEKYFVDLEDTSITIVNASYRVENIAKNISKADGVNMDRARQKPIIGVVKG